MTWSIVLGCLSCAKSRSYQCTLIFLSEEWKNEHSNLLPTPPHPGAEQIHGSLKGTLSEVPGVELSGHTLERESNNTEQNLAEAGDDQPWEIFFPPGEIRKASWRRGMCTWLLKE